MPSPSNSLSILHDACPPDEKERQIQFVHVSDHNIAKPASCTATARSHVMKRFHRRKQLDSSQRLENFRYVTGQEVFKKRKRPTTTQMKPTLLSPEATVVAPAKLDPFDCLAANASELPALLANPLIRQAGEPVVNFSPDTAYQSLDIVFRSSLADPALLNALLLTLTFEIHGDPLNSKFLTYKGETLRYINNQLQDPRQAVNGGLIGAILLLIGIEARLGIQESVQSHINGVALLLRLSESQDVPLHDGIKRAIFWQDLFSAVLTGSKRMSSHETFAELSWKRDPFRRSSFKAPRGFEACETILGAEFLAIVEDINALQTLRDAMDVDQNDAIAIMHLDNHQASIESRLYILGEDPMRFVNPTLYCCILASHICTYTLFMEIWSASTIPLRLSSYLLENIQSLRTDGHMIEYWDLFTWLICVGGIFAESGRKQDEFALLLNQHLEFELTPPTAPDTQNVLKNFVWSDKSFGKRWTVFWARKEALTALGRIEE